MRRRGLARGAGAPVSRLVLGGLMIAIALACLGTPAAVGSGTGWSKPTKLAFVANPLVASTMPAVSCGSASFCATIDLAGYVLTWNGSSWDAPVKIDNSAKDPYYLDGVSCVSASFCMAIDGTGNTLTWNGSAWSTPVYVDPGFAGLGLFSVSCASSAFCVAVAAFGNVLTWNGSAWSTPVKIDKTRNDVADVSCASASRCIATDLAGNAMIYGP